VRRSSSLPSIAPGSATCRAVMSVVVAETHRRGMLRVTCPGREVAQFAKVPHRTAARTLNQYFRHFISYSPKGVSCPARRRCRHGEHHDLLAHPHSATHARTPTRCAPQSGTESRIFTLKIARSPTGIPLGPAHQHVECSQFFRHYGHVGGLCRAQPPRPSNTARPKRRVCHRRVLPAMAAGAAARRVPV